MNRVSREVLGDSVSRNSGVAALMARLSQKWGRVHLSSTEGHFFCMMFELFYGIGNAIYF